MSLQDNKWREPVSGWVSLDKTRANGESVSNPVLTLNKNNIEGSVSTKSDECSSVDLEIGTESKCATGSGGKTTNPEEIVKTEIEEYLRCDQCGKIIPKTNQFSINYHGKHMVVCGKHYSQYLKFGVFQDNSPKSIFDSNEFEITDEGVWIYTFNRKNEPSGKFLIDIEDLENVIQKKWRFWRGMYFTGNFHPIQISTYLMNSNEDQVVDHINGNRWDNRRSNLRVTTQGKNTLNKAMLSNNHSGIAGVSWDKERNKWAPEIRMGGIRCHLGRYDNFADAVYVRYLAEVILFKEFRSTRNDEKVMKYIEMCERKAELGSYVRSKIKEKFSI